MNTRNWRDSAACRETDPELYFPTGEGTTAQQQADDAKAVCYRCPVIDVCLRSAMDNGQREGVWGGLTEQERHALSRRRRRSAAAGPPTVTVTEPTPPPTPQIRTEPLRTVRQAYDAMSNTADADGHITWTGPNSITIGREYYSPNQLAWRITHTPPPIGSITRTCNVPKCVAHLADQPMRDELKARKRKPGRQPAKCGTPGGYAAHRRRGEVACRGCKNANADADRRLRNTGTTLQLTG